MQHQHSTAAGRPCLTQFFYGFRRHGRHVRQFLGYILSPFRPSLPLRFPVREGCLCSISSTRQQQPSTSTPCSISTAAGRRCLTQFFYGFRRHVRHFLGSILALFRPSGPLCFPVRQGAFWASGGRAAAATGAAGGFYVSYVSLYNQWYKNWSKTIVFLGFQKGR